MRFVWAVVAFVLAAVMIVAGIAQRTVFQGPTSASESIAIAEEAPYVLIDGAVLSSRDGAQQMRVESEGEIFGAYGRTTDMTAWLGRTDYVSVTVGDNGEISSRLVTASVPTEEGDPALNMRTSDLWLDQFTQEGSFSTSVKLPENISFLLASDGEAPAPSELTLSWPITSTTPWAGPLIVLGSILLAVGLVLYVLAVRHLRRSRGPRRKGLPTGKGGKGDNNEPDDLSIEQSKKGVISAAPVRRKLTTGKRASLALPAVGLSVALLAGCSADAWPEFGSATPTPTASPEVVVPDGQGSPAVTQAQAERILQRISEVVAEADETADADLASQRLAGPALAVRETNYQIREEIDDHPALPPIPTETLQILLPEARDGWPRTFLAIVEQPDDNATVIMTVTQESAWEDYRVTYSANMAADTELNLAPSYVGALAVTPDSPFLVLPPELLASAYADVIDNGDESDFYGQFDIETDPLLEQIAAERADQLERFNETGEDTGTLSFEAAAGSSAPVSLATLDSGAVVAVTVNESEIAESTDADAVIRTSASGDDSGGNEIFEALTGATTGQQFTTTYLDQLFFFVPSQSSSQSIRLLGYSSAIESAEVVEE